MSKIRRTATIVKEVRYSSSSTDDSEDASEPSLRMPTFAPRVSKWQPYVAMSNADRRIRRSVIARNFEPEEPAVPDEAAVLGCNSTPSRTIRQSFGHKTILNLSPIVANRTVNPEEAAAANTDDEPICGDVPPPHDAAKSPRQRFGHSRGSVHSDVSSTLYLPKKTNIADTIVADFADDSDDENNSPVERRRKRKRTRSRAQCRSLREPRLATVVQQRVADMGTRVSDSLRKQRDAGSSVREPLKDRTHHIDSESISVSSCSDIQRVLSDGKRHVFVQCERTLTETLKPDKGRPGRDPERTLTNDLTAEDEPAKPNKAKIPSDHRIAPLKPVQDLKRTLTKDYDDLTTEDEPAKPNKVKILSDHRIVPLEPAQNLKRTVTKDYDDATTEDAPAKSNKVKIPSDHRISTLKHGQTLRRSLRKDNDDSTSEDEPAKPNKVRIPSDQRISTLKHGQTLRRSLTKNNDDSTAEDEPTKPNKVRILSDHRIVTVNPGQELKRPVTMDYDGLSDLRIEVRQTEPSKHAVTMVEGRRTTLGRNLYSDDRVLPVRNGSRLNTILDNLRLTARNRACLEQSRQMSLERSRTMSLERSRPMSLEQSLQMCLERSLRVSQSVGAAASRPNSPAKGEKTTVADSFEARTPNGSVRGDWCGNTSQKVRPKVSDALGVNKATGNNERPKVGRIEITPPGDDWNNNGDPATIVGNDAQTTEREGSTTRRQGGADPPVKNKRGRPRKNANAQVVGDSNEKRAKLQEPLGTTNEDFIRFASPAKRKDPPKGRAHQNGDQDQGRPKTAADDLETAENSRLSLKKSAKVGKRSTAEEGVGGEIRNMSNEEARIKLWEDFIRSASPTKDRIKRNGDFEHSRLNQKKSGRLGRPKTAADDLEAAENSRLSLKKSDKVGDPAIAEEVQELKIRNFSNDEAQTNLWEDFIRSACTTKKKDPPEERANRNGDFEHSSLNQEKLGRAGRPKIEKKTTEISWLSPQKSGKVGKPTILEEGTDDEIRNVSNEEVLTNLMEDFIRSPPPTKKKDKGRANREGDEEHSSLNMKKVDRVGRSKTTAGDHKTAKNSRLSPNRSDKVGNPTIPEEVTYDEIRNLPNGEVLTNLVEDFIRSPPPTKKKDPPKGRAKQNADEEHSSLNRKKSGRAGRPKTSADDHEIAEHSWLSLKKSSKIGKPTIPEEVTDDEIRNLPNEAVLTNLGEDFIRSPPPTKKKDPPKGRAKRNEDEEHSTPNPKKSSRAGRPKTAADDHEIAERLSPKKSGKVGKPTIPEEVTDNEIRNLPNEEARTNLVEDFIRPASPTKKKDRPKGRAEPQQVSRREPTKRTSKATKKTTRPSRDEAVKVSADDGYASESPNECGLRRSGRARTAAKNNILSIFVVNTDRLRMLAKKACCSSILLEQPVTKLESIESSPMQKADAQPTEASVSKTRGRKKKDATLKTTEDVKKKRGRTPKIVNDENRSADMNVLPEEVLKTVTELAETKPTKAKGKRGGSKKETPADNNKEVKTKRAGRRKKEPVDVPEDIVVPEDEVVTSQIAVPEDDVATSEIPVPEDEVITSEIAVPEEVRGTWSMNDCTTSPASEREIVGENVIVEAYHPSGAGRRNSSEGSSSSSLSKDSEPHIEFPVNGVVQKIKVASVVDWKQSEGMMVAEGLLLGNCQSGYLALAVRGVKDSQILRKSVMFIFILKGHGKFYIHDTHFYKSAGENILVPLGVRYSVENASDTERLEMCFVNVRHDSA